MKKAIFILAACMAFINFGQPVFAQNAYSTAVSALIPFGKEEDTGKKIPLILIHGIHGTEKNQTINATNGYWNVFLNRFLKDKTEDSLQSKYEIYLFQYRSDLISAYNIAFELGQAIDNVIPNRRHVILAHSMGGLVAKNYMVYYKHVSGNWKGGTGGETTLGLITLAAPHHGTPGANDSEALKDYYPSFVWRQKVENINFFYWMNSAGFFKTFVFSSNTPNRSDLRWDNYDNKISRDANTQLADANRLFKQYGDKIILYAGILKPVEPDALSAVYIKAADNHTKLSYADGMLYYGLNRAFGFTDGLVPYKSAMLCDYDERSLKELECSSRFRIRRFEFGNPRVAVPLPDAKTLSITRTPGGFDHQEMYESGFVLQKVAEDLLNFVPKPAVGIPPKPIAANVPEIPTLFLFDVSASMLENDKIGQARASSLIALREIQENKRLGRGDTPVSVWAFSGDCSPNAARQILPFTTNLTQAENTLSAKIPRPDGGTPLPEAIGKSISQMSAYLNTRPQIDQGRIILLSDGQSSCDAIRPAGVYSQARTITVKNIRFLTIGFDVAPGSAAERDLQFLASSSGGQYFPAQNQRQLSRAFEKTIRVYQPKSASGASAEFENVTNAILRRDFQRARQFAREYLKNNSSDALGYYNLAVSLEASGRYKGAAENYRKYLQFAPDATDRRETEARIEKLEQDGRDQFSYYRNLLQSDLDYLKAYYKRLFNQENEKNAREFAGFVSEKQEFYANLTDVMEIRSIRIERDAKDLSDSLGVLNRRVGLPSFDRDAVSLLTISIGQLEDIIERLETYKA